MSQNAYPSLNLLLLYPFGRVSPATPEDFKLGAINLHSLLNKMSTFRSFILLRGSDTAFATETWLHGFVLDCEVCIDGYNLVSHDRSFARGGGGGGGVLHLCSVTFYSLPSENQL